MFQRSVANKLNILLNFQQHVSGAIVSYVLSLTRMPVLTDAGLAVFVQAESPAAKTLKGASAVLARMLAATVHSQTLIDI